MKDQSIPNGRSLGIPVVDFINALEVRAKDCLKPGLGLVSTAPPFPNYCDGPASTIETQPKQLVEVLFKRDQTCSSSAILSHPGG